MRSRLVIPLVLWPLGDGQLLGQVLGEGRYFVDSDRAGVRRAASEWLQKEALESWVDEPEMVDPRLSFHSVPLQLAYRGRNGRAFPLTRASAFRVAAVHGRPGDDPRHAECFLPYLEERFYYYDSNQLGTLIQHFTRDFLEDLTPEQALTYQMAADPTLEVLNLNVGQGRRRRRHGEDAPPEILLNVAEPYPSSGRSAKAVGRWPRAAWERGDLVRQLSSSLLQTADNLLLVGEPGVGKSTIAFEAMRAVVRLAKEQGEGAAPTFWRTTPRRMIGKAKYLGEWQAICDRVVAALEQVNGILVLSEVTDALRSGGSGPEDSLAAYLLGFLAKGRLRILAEMTPKSLEAARGLLPAFVHGFEILRVPELERAETAAIMKRYAAYAAANDGIETDLPALDLAIALVDRYLRYQRNPGKQVQFFGRLIRAAHHEHITRVTEDLVLEQFIAQTGLPPVLLDDARALPRGELLDWLGQRIKGQDQVLVRLATLIQTFKAGINDPAKPVATLLFTGPTGVGKTAAVKALAEYFFANGQARDPLIRIDMSELQHPADIGRLIGYDGERPGKLIEQVRAQPFSVVLLDEIEKAYDGIFDTLLSLLDEGQLCDRLGRVTDFRNCIVVMTTNLGASAGRGIGFAGQEAGEVSLEEIKGFFRPELFNRIDQVIAFRPLDRDTIEQIAARELALLAERPGLARRGLRLRCTPRLVAAIAAAGFSPEYGARPLQRAIERLVTPVLAEHLLSGVEGDELTLDWVDGAVALV